MIQSNVCRKGLSQFRNSAALIFGLCVSVVGVVALGEDRMISHPQSEKGLLRIHRDGTYEYGVARKKRKNTVGFQLASLQSPKIGNSTNGLTYERVYGKNPLAIALFRYEYIPFQKLTTFSVSFGAGFGTARGTGVLQDSANSVAQERFDLYVLPLILGSEFRFQYSRTQWVVPALLAQFVGFGLVEKRDDRGALRYAGAPAFAAGGALHFGLSRISTQLGAQMEREYGLADFWLTVEAKAIQGLSRTVDFTSTMISAGVGADF